MYYLYIVEGEYEHWARSLSAAILVEYAEAMIRDLTLDNAQWFVTDNPMNWVDGKTIIELPEGHIS